MIIKIAIKLGTPSPPQRKRKRSLLRCPHVMFVSSECDSGLWVETWARNTPCSLQFRILGSRWWSWAASECLWKRDPTFRTPLDVLVCDSNEIENRKSKIEIGNEVQERNKRAQTHHHLVLHVWFRQIHCLSIALLCGCIKIGLLTHPNTYPTRTPTCTPTCSSIRLRLFLSWSTAYDVTEELFITPFKSRTSLYLIIVSNIPNGNDSEELRFHLHPE